MKESKAISKLCPFNNAYQSAGSVSMSVNTYCKGSDCMMWEAEQKAVKVKKEVKKESNYAEYKKHNYEDYEFSGVKSLISDKPKSSENIVIELTKYVDSDSGDCGLKPKELYCEGSN